MIAVRTFADLIQVKGGSNSSLEALYDATGSTAETSTVLRNYLRGRLCPRLALRTV